MRSPPVSFVNVRLETTIIKKTVSHGMQPSLTKMSYMPFRRSEYSEKSYCPHNIIRAFNKPYMESYGFHAFRDFQGGLWSVFALAQTG